jgi:DNA-binding LacI/PurR family transcriptional regulator
MTKSKPNSVTIREVASRAEVSVATVSRVINGTVTVSPDAAQRVQAAMRELNFIPHAAARSLATSKTRTIGLMMTEISGDFFTPLLRGIEDTASHEDYNLLISTSTRRNPQNNHILPLGRHNTDGILVYASSLNEAGLSALCTAGIPVVLIHRSSPETLNVPCVTVENKAASRKIVEHLIDVHQRKRILFLKGPADEEDSFWRENGYREALDSRQIAFDGSLVAPGEFDRQTAQSTVGSLLSNGITFDAIFAGDDESAIGAMTALQEAGLRVPEDVSVAGFDDQWFAAFLSPGLTTVRAPTEDVGREAARQLIQLIRGGQAAQLTLLPTEIVIRRSCGCGSS